MSIYIVHIDAWKDDRLFENIPDEEIEAMYEADDEFIDKYDSIEELSAAWNSDEIFYPNASYMRIVNE